MENTLPAESDYSHIKKKDVQNPSRRNFLKTLLEGAFLSGALPVIKKYDRLKNFVNPESEAKPRLSDVLMIDFNGGDLAKLQAEVNNQLREEGATSREISLGQLFFSPYAKHGDLVRDSADSIFKRIGTKDTNLEPNLNPADLSAYIQTTVSRDELGNIQIIGEVSSKEISSTLKKNQEKIIVCAFPFGETRIKYVKYERSPATNFTFKKEFHPTDDGSDIIVVDRLGREIKMGYEGGMPQAQIMDESGQIVEALTWSESYQYEDHPDATLVWMSQEEFEEFSKNNQSAGEVKAVDNSGIEITEGYNPDLAQNNLQKLFDTASENEKTLIINSAGNRDSYASHLSILKEKPQNVLLVGGFVLMSDPLTLERKAAFGSGSDIADVFLDPKDFDKENISSSEAAGIFGGIVSSMIELGFASNPLNAKELILNEYAETVTYYVNTYDQNKDASKIEQTSRTGWKLNWKKIKGDLEKQARIFAEQTR